MNLIEFWDNHLLADYAKEQHEEYHGKWRPSSYGSCYRKQYLQRAKVPHTNIPDNITLRQFARRHLGHNLIQKYLPIDSIEQEFNTTDECGHADFIVDDRVIDFKWIGDWQFKKMFKFGYDIVKEKEGYILQVVRYAMAFKKPMAELLFFNTNSCLSNRDRGIVFEFKVSDWQDKVEGELNNLRTWWEFKKIPPAKPRHSWECEWASGCCSYLDYCKSELEADKVKEEEKKKEEVL